MCGPIPLFIHHKTRGRAIRGERNGPPVPKAPSGRQSPLRETHGLVKRGGALVVHDWVDRAVCAGEAHALLGENSAKKSTLVKVLSGLL